MSNYDVWPHGLKGIFDTSFEEHTSAKTAQARAFSYVIDRYMGLLKEYSEHIILFREIENLPENTLDYLAIEWDLPYYEDSLDINTKVKLVKEGFNWRRTAGTVAGVETLIKKMFGEGRVQEWHEYGGEPGYFKVTTNAPLVEDMKKFFTVLLRKEKNARSWLESVEVTRDIDVKEHLGVYTRQVMKAPAPIVSKRR